MAARRDDGHARMTFSAPWRKLMLLLHVATSVGFPGAVAGFLSLAIAGLTTSDPAIAAAVYPAMGIVTSMVILPLAVASLLIGVVQSLGTPWGLFRYYWVIVKLALTVIVLVVLLLQLEGIELASRAALAGEIDAMPGLRVSMVLHGAGGLAVLLAVTVLSIYKPRGMTALGVRAIAAGR
jgi:hypothetical protein